MATLNPPKKISRRHELRQDQVVTVYARAWDFVDKNRTLIWGIVAALVLLVALAIAYVFYQQNQEAEAQEAIAAPIRLYEQENYREALDGADGAMGFLAIADEYGGTDAGNLAHFYAADALFNLGEYDQALEHFEDFGKEENYLGASALAGEAAVYENQGEYERAGQLYQRAASHLESELTSPQYLLSAGRAFEEAGNYAGAQAAYETLRDDFPDAPAAQNVDAYLARVAALAADA